MMISPFLCAGVESGFLKSFLVGGSEKFRRAGRRLGRARRAQKNFYPGQRKPGDLSL